MKHFRSVFSYEVKCFFSNRNKVIIALLFILALSAIQVGVSNSKDKMNQKQKFKEFEKTKVESILNYRQYGFLGFRVMFMPPPISIFFINSVPVSDMTAHIDSGMSLKIFKSLKGKNIFAVRENWFSDYNGIIIFLVSLMALVVGYEAYNEKEYLKMRASIIGKTRLFVYIGVARSILFVLVLLVLKAFAVGLVRLNGIALPVDKYLLGFFLIMVFAAVVFLGLGAMFSTVKRVPSAIACALICWFLLLFIIPGALNTYIAKKADDIKSNFLLEKEKLKIVMDFENKSSNAEGNLTSDKEPSEKDKELMVNYFENEFKRIMDLEKEMISQMRQNTYLYHKLSLLFPTTVYDSFINDLSGKGYLSMLEFYENMNETKRKFFKFYLDKVYLSNFSEVESFVKDEENVFMAGPRMPYYFVLGLLVMTAWGGLFWTIAFRRYKKAMLDLPVNKQSPAKKVKLDFEEGQFRSFLVTCNLLSRQLYCILQGEGRELKKKGFDHTVTLAGRDLVTETQKQNFLYICHPKHIPGWMRVKNFLSHFFDLADTPPEKREEIVTAHGLDGIQKKTFNRLDMGETCAAILGVLSIRPFKIYLLDDITRDTDQEFAVSIMDKAYELTDGAGALVLCPHKAVDLRSRDLEDNYFRGSTAWRRTVSGYKGLSGDLEKLKQKIKKEAPQKPGNSA